MQKKKKANCEKVDEQYRTIYIYRTVMLLK